MNTGALHCSPARQLITPLPYSPPMMNAAFFRSGMTSTQRARRPVFLRESRCGSPERAFAAARQPARFAGERAAAAVITSTADRGNELLHTHLWPGHVQRDCQTPTDGLAAHAAVSSRACRHARKLFAARRRRPHPSGSPLPRPARPPAPRSIGWPHRSRTTAAPSSAATAIRSAARRCCSSALPVDRVEPTPYQRDPSDAHVKRLMARDRNDRPLPRSDRRRCARTGSTSRRTATIACRR